MAWAGRVQQQPRRFDGITRNDDGACALKVLFTFTIKIDDAINAAIVAQADPGRHAVGTNLRAMRDGVGNMRDERTGFRSDLAALQAEAAIDAMRTVSMRCRQNCDGTAGYGADAEFGAAAYENIADTTKRMRSVRMPVRITPGKPCRACDGDFSLKQFVIGLQIPIGDGPVRANTIFGIHAEI